MSIDRKNFTDVSWNTRVSKLKKHLKVEQQLFCEDMTKGVYK